MPETRKRHRGDKIAHKARGMPNEHLGPSSKAQRVGQSGHGLHCEHRPGRLEKPSGADLGRRRGPAVGLSIRQMASTKRLSSSQVHRLLGTEESLEIPWWLSQRRGRRRPLSGPLRPPCPPCGRRWRLFAGATRAGTLGVRGIGRGEPAVRDGLARANGQEPTASGNLQFSSVPSAYQKTHH